MFESKASRGLKTERTRQYVSISIRGTTQLSHIRWGFETTSGGYFNHILPEIAIILDLAFKSMIRIEDYPAASCSPPEADSP